MTEVKRWFSAAELADLNLESFPSTKRGINALVASERWQRPEWEGRKWRIREDRGGGVEYHVSILPILTQARVLALHPDVQEAAADTGRALWKRWAGLRETQREEAHKRLAVLTSIAQLQAGGRTRGEAIQAAHMAHGVSRQSIYNYERLVMGLDSKDWLPALAPLSRASAEPVEIPQAALDYLMSDWLRPAKPSVDACLRRLKQVAAEKGWVLPSDRTLRRRIADIPAAAVALHRDGKKTQQAMFPAQERSRAAMHAMHMVNADGHRFDVFVRWDDGKIDRPTMLAFQDIYSGMLLSWRVDRSEHAHLVRLAYGDMVSVYGIPEHALLDNGRAFASKQITGGTKTRYRFKVRDEDLDGVIVACGTQVHWATPYPGQAKPIERMFRDFAGDFSKHPAFAGAYTGNKPSAKPEDYGSAAVPIDTFLKLLQAAIAEHNARPGRRTETCGGVKSFRQAFEESLQSNGVRKASPGQERLWLLAAENVKPRKPDGAIHLFGNRYWHPELGDWIGRPLVVRFDPQLLHAPLAVYLPDGRMLFEAEVIEAVGFADATQAATHSRNRRAWMRATAEVAAIETRLKPAELAAMLPDVPELPAPQPKILRPIFNGNAAMKPREELGEVQSAGEIEVLAAVRRMTAGRLHVVQPDDEFEG